jgi:hypothetical protein
MFKCCDAQRTRSPCPSSLTFSQVLLQALDRD